MDCSDPQKWQAPPELQQMLLDIAESADGGTHLSFIEFAKLIVAVLVDAIEPEQIAESAKADIVNELWKKYTWRRRKI